MNFNNIDWKTVFHSIGHPSLILDPQHNVIAANQAVMNLLAMSHEEIQGKKCYKLFHGTKTPPARCPMRKTLVSGQAETVEMQMETIKGTVLVSCTPIFNDKDHIERVVHVAADITGHKETVKTIEESEEKYRSLVESTEDSIYLIDRNYRYLFINSKHLSRIGLPNDQFIQGLAFHEFHTSEETETFIEKVDKVFETGESHQYEYLSRRDGRYFLQTFSPLKGTDGRTTAITVISKDITKLKQMEEALRNLSFTDELTELYNRRGFMTLAQQQLKVANRLQRGALLLYLDIDNLKQINDKYGHHEGDRVLTEAAGLFKEIFRESDIVARIGGDEFVVLSIESSDNSIETINTRLQQRLEAYNAKTNRPYKLMISTGIVYCEEGYSSIDELIITADKMMYEQKKNKLKT